MSMTPVRRFMDSAELAGVREVTTTRTFVVEGEQNGGRAVVEYNVDRDELFCTMHKRKNDCTCSGLIRMCGILTHTVSKKMPVFHFDIGAMAKAAQENR